MPYKTINDLPDGVRRSLPEHAQDIYKEAFNSAFEHYDSPNDRQDQTSRDETAHKVAWGAVKKAGYEKTGDDAWHKAQ